MKPSRKVSSGIEDLFRSRFENIINLRHELVVLGGRIAWTFFDETYEALYSEEGRPGVPTRLMVGLHILKHMFDLSDEEVCERWVYDPYFQCFCGEEYFQHELPMERSSMTRWRDRIGPEGLEKVFQESLAVAHRVGALRNGISLRIRRHFLKEALRTRQLAPLGPRIAASRHRARPLGPLAARLH